MSAGQLKFKKFGRLITGVPLVTKSMVTLESKTCLFLPTYLLK